MAAATKNTEKNKDKRLENLILWKPGQSGNPKGRQLGQRNRKTVVMDALRRLADLTGRTPEEIEEAIQATGIARAIKGSYFHYEAISDALYGKMTDKVDISSGGMTLADLIKLADAQPKRKITASAKRSGRKVKAEVPG